MKTLPSPFKQGASFSCYVDYSIAGVAEVFPPSDLTSQVRNGANAFLTQLVITADPGVVGRFLLKASAVETAKWPVGTVMFDVKRTSNGVTTPTETVAITVIRGVTT